jgi:hypothetical protein
LFTSDFPCVWDPYTHGATLTNAGFSTTGIYSSGWTVTDSGTQRDAFFAFGSGGEPLDSATLQPPADLFAPGDMYSYDAGSSEGGVDIQQVTPEPSALVLGAVAALACLVVLWVYPYCRA